MQTVTTSNANERPDDWCIYPLILTRAVHVSTRLECHMYRETHIWDGCADIFNDNLKYAGRDKRQNFTTEEEFKWQTGRRTIKSFTMRGRWEVRKWRRGSVSQIWVVVERCVWGKDSTLRNCQAVRKAGEGQRTSWESCLIVHWNKACSPSWQRCPGPPPAR